MTDFSAVDTKICIMFILLIMQHFFLTLEPREDNDFIVLLL